MADIHIPHNRPKDICGDKETLRIHFDQDYTLCAAHPESFTGPMGGLPVGRHPPGFVWSGHPNPAYPGSKDVLYCFEPGSPPCTPCKPVGSRGKFAGHIIHVGGISSLITLEDIRDLIESLESVAHTETFRSSWPATMTLLEKLIKLKKHPLPASLEEIFELLIREGQAVYKGTSKKD